MKKFEYEIVEPIATLSENNGYTVELNLISFNGAEPKIDIRRWDKRNGATQMLKGVALTVEEAQALKNNLVRYFGE